MVVPIRPLKSMKRVPPEAAIIGRNIRNMRRAAGLSQTDIGDVLGITFQQVQKYENGLNRLPPEKIFFLKHFYGVAYDRFFHGLKPPTERIGGKLKTI